MNNTPDKRYLIEHAIDTYIKDFEKNNHWEDPLQRNETVKWNAAVNFAQNWDIDAEDMLSMWRKSTKDALIDTGKIHPTQGITNLLKKPAEVEGVRDAFRKLFQEDTGDVEEKWDRIQKFIEYINGRLQDLYPTSTLYLQTKEGVITYLNLWDPDHNYRYKPEPANNWAKYISYGDWTTGQMFSLRKYYKMCDELHEVVKNHKELLRVHQQRFQNGLPDCDKELHILTFDVLYCFWGYKDPMGDVLKKYKEAMRQQLKEQIYEIEEKIQNITGQFLDVKLVGLVAHHFTHGDGIVTDVTDKQITVDYEGRGPVKSQYPQTILKGFISFDDDSIIEMLKSNEELNQKKAALEEEKKQIMVNLESLEGS